MSNRYPSRYKPGFSEHRIPDRYAWLDQALPWFIFFMGILVMGAATWGYLS